MIDLIHSQFNSYKSGNVLMVNADCMAVMRSMGKKSIDLLCTDPPYGIGVHNMNLGKGKKRDTTYSQYDDEPPGEDYFSEAFSISKNQIIWGGNYFNLPPNRCNLIWDKIQQFSGADFELAWTSFDKSSKAFRMARAVAYGKGTIHPTQKPVRLYEWIYRNYIGAGGIVFDSHAGSFSSAIAARNCGIKYIGCEINKQYFESAVERFKAETRQGIMYEFD